MVQIETTKTGNEDVFIIESRLLPEQMAERSEMIISLIRKTACQEYEESKSFYREQIKTKEILFLLDLLEEMQFSEDQLFEYFEIEQRGVNEEEQKEKKQV